MDRLLALSAAMVLVGFACGCATQRPGEADGSLRVMSFNVRTLANDGINVWPNRKELCLQTIRGYEPDLLGTQEAMEAHYDALVEGLPEMQIVGVARDDGARRGEWSAVMFRKRRFELLDSGTFWLSETPDVVGSKSWDTSVTRICTWALLRDRRSGRMLLCANAHLDHRGEIARRESAKLLARKLPELAKGAPIVLMGDFNTTEDSQAYATLTGPEATTRFVDSYRAIHPERSPEEATFHAFTGRTNGSRIDYILHTEGLRTRDAQILRIPAKDGVYPSDHHPVVATLDF